FGARPGPREPLRPRRVVSPGARRLRASPRSRPRFHPLRSSRGHSPNRKRRRSTVRVFSILMAEGTNPDSPDPGAPDGGQPTGSDPKPTPRDDAGAGAPTGESQATARAPLDRDGMERPKFLLNYPDDPALERLIAAFESGNYALVRRDAEKVA